MGWWGNWRQTAPAHIGNLQATDLLDCTSIIGGVEVNNTITGAQIIAAASGGSSPYTTVGNSAGILVNNSTTNTISASILIPGSTLIPTKVLQLRAQVRKIGGSGTTNVRFYINTINSLVGATQIAQGLNMTGSGLMQRVGRDIYILTVLQPI
jgi:hypothetical protein